MQPEGMIVACVLLLTAFISKYLFLLLFKNDLLLILREGQGESCPFNFVSKIWIIQICYLLVLMLYFSDLIPFLIIYIVVSFFFATKCFGKIKWKKASL